jgi:hypothetical protein
VNGKVFKKHIGVCTLDNCPFTANSTQSDINNNGIGDICETFSKDLLNQIDKNADLQRNYDQDKDGVPDSIDRCPSIPGALKDNGCPVLNGNATANLDCDASLP